MSVTASNICSDALLELNIIQAGDTASADDLAFVLGKLNRLLDNWNADTRAVYANQFLTFTLTGSLSPHTIGVAANSPTFVVTGNRPEVIEGANVMITSGGNSVAIPITIRDDQWWLDQRVKTQTSTIPTDLYYEPAWPNGSLYFWPVPTVGNSVELECRRVLSQLALTDAFSLPPGYRDAITKSLAEEIAVPYEQTDLLVPIALAARTARAVSRIWSRLSTEQGPAITATESAPNRTSPTETLVGSGRAPR